MSGYGLLFDGPCGGMQSISYTPPPSLTKNIKTNTQENRIHKNNKKSTSSSKDEILRTTALMSIAEERRGATRGATRGAERRVNWRRDHSLQQRRRKRRWVIAKEKEEMRYDRYERRDEKYDRSGERERRFKKIKY